MIAFFKLKFRKENKGRAPSRLQKGQCRNRHIWEIKCVINNSKTKFSNVQTDLIVLIKSTATAGGGRWVRERKKKKSRSNYRAS